MRNYFDVMGSLYSHKYDPALFRIGIERTILSPEALNRAHGPGGFLRSFDLRPELGAIAAPTLILSGRHDWICAPEFSEELHQLIPNSDLRIFEESSHLIASDEPQKFIDAVSGFLVYKA
jgi:proline iminopeptidase